MLSTESISFDSCSNKLFNLLNSFDLETFLKIQPTINETNAPQILSFMNRLLTEKTFQPELKDIISNEVKNINDKLRSLIPDYLHFLIVDKIDIYEPEVESIQTLDSFLFNILLLTRKAEMQQRLNSFFKISRSNEFSPFNVLMKYIDRSCNLTFYFAMAILLDESNSRAFVNHLLELSYSETLPAFMDHFYENLQFLFFFLKKYNPITYERIVEYIYSEKRFFKAFLIKNILDINAERLFKHLRAYNFDILTSLFEDRPFIVKSLIKEYTNGNILIPKKQFMEKISEYGDWFAEYLTLLPFEDQELLELCDKNEAICLKYYSNIKAHRSVVEYARIVSSKEDSFLLKLLNTISFESDKNASLLLKTLAKIKIPSTKIQEFLINRIGHIHAYFSIVAPYMDISQIESLLSKHYVQNTSIDALLKRFHSKDFLIEIHKFSDEFLIKKLVSEASQDTTKFEDSSFVFLLQYLSTVDNPFIILTCIPIVQNRLNLKDHVLWLLNSRLDDSFFCSNPTGLLELLELLQHDSIKLLERFSDTVINDIINTSSEIKIYVEEAINKADIDDRIKDIYFKK